MGGQKSSGEWLDAAERSRLSYDLPGFLGGLAMTAVANLNPFNLLRDAWRRAGRKK